MHTFFQAPALLQEPAGHAGALDMTLHQRIRVKLRGVARQDVQRLSSRRRGHVVLHPFSFLVGQQVIDRQMQRLFTPTHQLLEQLDEQRAGKSTRVCCKPEGPPGHVRRDRRDQADRFLRLVVPGTSIAFHDP